MRTLLFVPADSERKLVKAVAAGSDALAIDLEDSVLPARKAAGREMLIDFAKTYSAASELWVRVNDLTSGELLRDLTCVVKVAPKGILLPKIRDRQDVETVQNYLSMAESMAGLEDGTIKILAIATETPQIIMNMPGSNGQGWPSSGMNLSVSTSGVSSFFSANTYFLSVTGMTAIGTPRLV